MTVRTEDRGSVRVVTIDRPERRNAVDSVTAAALLDAFEAFDADDALAVAVLTGAGGYFCAGADLKALAEGDRRPVGDDGPGPMGPTRLRLGKPVIAAIEGPAVAGGLELALWCDLRVAASDAMLGVYCRRFGVPLVDLGTVRLPRLIGHSRAIDLILTGRGVDGVEAERIGLVNRVAAPGEALAAAIALADELAALPATVHAQRPAVGARAVGPRRGRRRRVNEAARGRATIESGETLAGAARFASVPAVTAPWRRRLADSGVAPAVDDVDGCRPAGAASGDAWGDAPRAVPVAVVLTVVLVVRARRGGDRVAVLVYGVCVTAMLTVSGIYHSAPPGHRERRLLRRLDHSMILVGIAGTYTAVIVLALDGTTRVVLLVVAWALAVVGVAIRMLWLDAPSGLVAARLPRRRVADACSTSRPTSAALNAAELALLAVGGGAVHASAPSSTR